MDDAGEFAVDLASETRRHVARQLVMDVLGPDLQLIASFASVTEAFRYASLIYSPTYVPVFARACDGGLLQFAPRTGVAALENWLATP